MVMMRGMFAQQPMGFPEQRKLTTLDKIGLVGDIFTENPVTQRRINDQQLMEAKLYEQRMAPYQPQKLGDSLIQLDPNGQVRTLYTAPQTQADDAFTRSLLEGGVVRGSPEWVAAHARRAASIASPQPQFVSDGMGGGQFVTPPLAPLFPQASTPAPNGLPPGYTVRKRGGSMPSASGSFR